MTDVYSECDEYGEMDELFNASAKASAKASANANAKASANVSAKASAKASASATANESYSLTNQDVLQSFSSLGDKSLQFITTPKRVYFKYNFIIEKRMTLKEQMKEKTRIYSKMAYERKKAKYQATIDYSISLLEQNENLKQQITLLNAQINELKMLYRQKYQQM